MSEDLKHKILASARKFFLIYPDRRECLVMVDEVQFAVCKHSHVVTKQQEGKKPRKVEISYLICINLDNPNDIDILL